MCNVIELKNVSLQLKDFSLNNITFSLNKGYIMFLTGHNGAGKSSYFKNHSVIDNAKIYKLYWPNLDMTLFNKYIDEFQVPPTTPLCNLSKGTYIKFQLALAAALHTLIYIMDEPTAGFDPVLRKDFVTHLHSLTANENATMLISSHNFFDADLLADYVTLIDNGSLVYTKEHLTNKRVDYSDFTGTN